MGSQMKEMSKRGEGKEKTNKEELGLYEIMILRNAHHFSNPKLKEKHFLTHQLLLVVEEERDLTSDTGEVLALCRGSKVSCGLFKSSSLWTDKTNFLIIMDF